MSEHRYRVTGKLNIPVDILTDHAVGDVVEAELDKDLERLLVDAGAIVKLPAERKPAAKQESSTKKAAAADKEES